MVSEEVEKYERKLKKFYEDTIAFEKAFSGQMEQKISEILELEKHDTVYENILHYFKVGRDYSHDEIMKITIEGKHRYEFKIPPGYEDLKDKIGTQIFGDLIIWKQILEYSKENRKNIVFVCNDLKEDWWNMVTDRKDQKKRPGGPRREQIKELKDHSGGNFWMYRQARFLDLANTLIRSNVPSKYIEQISKLNAAKPFEKPLVYVCDNCRREDVIDTSELALNFGSKGSGTENKYIATTSFNCRHCNHAIEARFEVSESPEGIIGRQEVTLKGASLLSLTDDKLLEEYEQESAPLEEITLIDKKQFRLKKGSSRKIGLGKAVDGHDTLFQIGYKNSKTNSSATRLLVEGSGKQKTKFSKTLVLADGVSSFMLQSLEEQPGEEFTHVQLTPDEDMTIVLSVTEYPGSGRFIEKLY
jgi:hypothetical protein